MTLIATTLNFKKPFIIGDIVISTNELGKNIQLPTNTIDINEHLTSSSGSAESLYQKVYIINDNVVLALAGDVLEITQLLKEFKTRCSYYDVIDKESIGSFLDGYDLETNFSKSALLILRMERGAESISVDQFWHPKDLWQSKDSQIFEQVLACGSGGSDFLYQAAEQQRIAASSDEKTIHRAIATNVGFIAKLLAVERVSLYTLKKRWGGGFEVIFFNGISFEKFDKVAYIISHGEFTENGDIGMPMPQLIQYYEYYKDVLFITAIEVNKWTGSRQDGKIVLRSNSFRVDLFIVPRLDLPSGSFIELPPSHSFKTNRIGMGYALITKLNGIFAPSYYAENSGISVTYNDRREIEVVISIIHNEWIQDGARQAFPNL